jgi:hypothetical protein
MGEQPFCAYGRGPIKVTKSRCWNARTVRMPGKITESEAQDDAVSGESF